MSNIYTQINKLAIIFFSVSVFSFFSLASSPISSIDTTASTSVTVASACTFNATENVVHNAIIPSGTYKNNIGTTTFNITCNDNEGYSIYAIGYSNNEFGNNKLLATINGNLAPSYDIATGINTSGNPSSWAMKLTPKTGLTSANILNSYTDYNIVPTQYTKIATITPTTTPPISTTYSASLEATYASNVSPTQPAGIYEGKVRYAMVHPATNIPNQTYQPAVSTVGYHPNAEGTVLDTMGNQIINDSDTSITLWASNFQRRGYGFVGWSDKFDWELNSQDENGNGTGPNQGYHIYGPNQTITDTDTVNKLKTNGLSLYAVWVKSQGFLQDWNSCNLLSIGEVTALTDKRDNNAYAVAKLKDGKCWMIENLKLDNTNSDNATGILAQGYASNFKGLAASETTNFEDSTAANSLYSADSGDGKNLISGDYIGYRFPRYNNANTANPVQNMIATNRNTYSYGNYYTWASVIADTNSYNSTNPNTQTTSICPKGWRLPNGGDATNKDNSDYWQLSFKTVDAEPDTSLSGDPNRLIYSGAKGLNASNLLRSYPNNFVYSANIRSDSASNFKGRRSYYWTNTVVSFDNSFAFYIDSVNGSHEVAPGTRSFSKYSAQTIRCLFGAN